MKIDRTLCGFGREVRRFVVYTQGHGSSPCFENVSILPFSDLQAVLHYALGSPRQWSAKKSSFFHLCSLPLLLVLRCSLRFATTRGFSGRLSGPRWRWLRGMWFSPSVCGREGSSR